MRGLLPVMVGLDCEIAEAGFSIIKDTSLIAELGYVLLRLSEKRSTCGKYSNCTYEE